MPNTTEAVKQPAWRLLAAETGVQQLQYDDAPRTNVRALFGHTPRRLLDIGCAAGAVSGALKQSIPGLWAWGCELNEAQAKVAATRLDHVTTSARPEWTPNDVARVKSVDTVLLLDVLEHMYNPWAELEFLAKHLGPDAQVIVSLPNVGHISVLTALAHGAFPYSPIGILDVTHVRFFTLASMRAMFDETGFQIGMEAILTNTPSPAPDQFPATFEAGKMELRVDSLQEWDRLNAVQFGFRLKAKPRAANKPAVSWGSSYYR